MMTSGKTWSVKKVVGVDSFDKTVVTVTVQVADEGGHGRRQSRVTNIVVAGDIGHW